MFIDIDYNKRKKGYKINLAKPNQKTIASISEAYGANYSIKLGNINEVTFNVPYFIDKLDERVKNENIELIKERMYTKISYNNNDEWMIIDSIEDVGSGDEKYMVVTAFTNVYETSNRKISELNLEVVNPEEYYDAVLNDVAWSIGTIDPLFKNIYRSVELSNVTVLEAIITGAETFGAILDFDTENKKINLIDIDSKAKYRGLNINYSNFLQSINRKRNTDEMTTRLYVYGSEGLSIEKVNPTGMRYLEDFTYFIYPFERDENKNVIKSSHYMSDELAHAVLDKNELTEEYQPLIQAMQEEIDEETIEYINETTLLNDLRFDEMTVSGLLDIAKATGDNNLILQRQGELAEIKTKISIKELTVDHIDATIEDLERQISQLQSRISVTSFSKELYDELSMYIIEREFRDDRYIDEEELYHDALKKFEEAKSPNVVIEASIDNIIDSLEEDYYSDKVVLGDIARVTDKEMSVEMKSLIVELTFDLDNNTCDVTIANGDIEKDGYDRILSVLYDTQSTTTMLENNKYKWDTVTDVKTEVDLMRDSEIDATKNRIKAGFRESVTIEDRGIILSNPDFPNEIVIMQAGVIALSTDGGENWSTSITPRGVVAETIIGRLVASSNLIVTNDSGSFRIDGEGLTVDMDSIKIMSGEGDTPENIVDSWNNMLITMDEFADDGKLNEYEKNQIARQWNSIAISHSSMVDAIQNAYGPETPENQYPAEYEIYMESYERLRRYLNDEIQSDGHTILDPLHRSETTDIDSDKYNSLVSDYEVNKDRFQTVIPLEFSQTFIEQTRQEISLNYVKNGEVVNKLNLSEEGIKIDGRLLEINSKTEFNDDLTMNAGVIKSKDDGIIIDLNAGTINLSRPLTINAVPVATEEYVEGSLTRFDDIETEWTQTFDSFSQTVTGIDGRVTEQNQTIEGLETTIQTTQSDLSGTMTLLNQTRETVDSRTSVLAELRTDVDGKVTTTKFNTLENTVDGSLQRIGDAEGNITQIEENVNGLQTTVADKANQSQVTQLATLVSSKVSNSDFTSQIGQLSNSINLRVTKGELLSQINIEAERTLIQSDKLLLNANNTVITGTAWMDGAIIKSLDVGKITGETSSFVQSNWNSAIGGGVSISGETGIRTRASSREEARLENGGISFYDRIGWYRGKMDSSYNNDGTGGISIFIQNGNHFSIVRESIGSYTPILWLEGYSNVMRMNTNMGFQGNRIVDIQSIRFSGGNAAVRRQGSNNVEITTYGEDNTAVLFGKTTAQFYRSIDMNGRTITNQSDIRLKTNVEKSHLNALKEIERLEFIEYEWDRTKANNETKPEDRQFGIVAQYSPFLQTKAGESESYLSVDLTKQINLNSKALQEILRYTRKLEERIEVLENEG